MSGEHGTNATGQGEPFDGGHHAQHGVSLDRQQFLEGRLQTQVDTYRGIYPFRNEADDIELTRADVEYLLARQQHRRRNDAHGVDGQDGLDLRGANLQGVDLGGLSLVGIRGGFTWIERRGHNLSQCELAGARFGNAGLYGVNFSHAILSNAHFDGSDLNRAVFRGAILFRAHFDGADARKCRFEGANLRLATMTDTTQLKDATFAGEGFESAILADVLWRGANLASIDWSPVKYLGDEADYRQFNAKAQDRRETKLSACVRAVRAYRQLSVALRSQGLNEDADRYAYRAQTLQREVLWRQGHGLRWLGSFFLYLISGYGYKPLRSFLTYLLVVLGFGVGYFALTNIAMASALTSHSTPLAWYEAIVLSISSFHGRGFFPAGLMLGDPIAILAAGEAVLGLLIEIIFIATFTQRFFAR